MPNQDDSATKPVHQLLIEVQSNLYTYVYSLVGNASEAYDILQETNLAILAKDEDYDPSRNFSAWAFRFAQVQVMAYRKRHARDRLQFDDELVSLLADDFESNMMGADGRLDALGNCLEKLPETHRRIVTQCYAHGQQPVDIAKTVGKSVSAVRSSLFRIRQQLLDCIRRRTSTEAIQ